MLAPAIRPLHSRTTPSLGLCNLNPYGLHMPAMPISEQIRMSYALYNINLSCNQSGDEREHVHLQTSSRVHHGERKLQHHCNEIHGSWLFRALEDLSSPSPRLKNLDASTRHIALLLASIRLRECFIWCISEVRLSMTTIECRNHIGIARI